MPHVLPLSTYCGLISLQIVMLRSCAVCGRIHDARIKCKSSLPSDRTDAQRFRSSGAWQRKRDEIVTRDLGLCQASLREMPPRYVTDDLQVHHISKVESDCDSAKEAVNTTFDKEEELNTKLARLKELNAILEMDNSSNKANKKQDIVESSDDEYHYAKVNEKQKDILFSEGYKDFAPSDDGGKFIVKYPAADKVKVQQLLNNNAIKL